MRELGSEGPAAWTAEWQARGEVVFPQRRRSLWWRLGLFGLLTLSSGWQLVDNLRDESELTFITVVSAVPPIWCCVFGYTVWQLITGRPVVRIDRFGVHYGSSKRTRLAWGRIATISDPIGRWLFAYLNVRPADGKPRRLPISHLHVDDLRPFALWLRSRLEEQRALAGAAAHDEGGNGVHADQQPEENR
ncbi:hypothetical protein [Kribbella lupini]|uniref:hypothetical protein n=1 Tax=Kribbella lupini TaxID=291602 RepID=UPI0031D106F7